MKSLRELYRPGIGPSSSHTMGPRRAAESFRDEMRQAGLPTATVRVRVTLYGSLAATGRGHLTDVAVGRPFVPLPVEIVWRAEETLPRHPNGMRFETLGDGGELLVGDRHDTVHEGPQFRQRES